MSRSQEVEVVVLGGARTPFGSFGGSLKDVSAIELGAVAAAGALARAGVAAEETTSSLATSSSPATTPSTWRGTWP